MAELNQPTVSVVIPCLNRAQFLVPTIESILQQDYPNIECIVMDGGSTDDTLEILHRYEGRIKWISERDDGQASAINRGWQLCHGDIFAWLNADDLWEVPNAVSQVVAYLHTHPEVDLVYGDCGAIDADGNLICMSYLHEWDLKYAIENCDHCIPQPAAFIRRRILEQVGWLDTQLILMDQDLWYRIGLIGDIRHIPIPLAYARRHSSYWYSRSYIVSTNCVRIIKKIFKNSELPEEIIKIKRRALSNAYVRGMDFAWYGRHWKTIFAYAQMAIFTDPSNVRKALGRFTRYVRLGSKEEVWLGWLLPILDLSTMPRRISRKLRSMLKPIGKSSYPQNLLGDRDIEWSWVASQIPSGPGHALDFGTGRSFLGLIAAQKEFNVVAVDLTSVQWLYRHSRLRFVRGDILKLPLLNDHFDLIINCSAIEHVGLSGRYGVNENRPDGDLEAMKHLRELMKPGGTMILTVPVGQDAVFSPLHRVYGKQRLPKLLEGYTIVKDAFWAKNDDNRWVMVDKDAALGFKAASRSPDPKENIYALGCFVLRKYVNCK